ncbi:MAG: aminotransferase class I/II-fold pyridoxal phosphate-dependent enzyme [Acidobacteriota bacterium]
MPEYFQAHSARQDSAYDAASNPDGYIPMSVAENELAGHLLLERMAAVEVPKDVLAYGPMIGSLDFRQKLSRFLARAVFGRTFAPEQIAVLAGAGSVLEMLFHNLCDPGDAVLVPTPSYAGFWADLETRDEVQILPVHTYSGDGFRLTPEALDRALQEASAPVKALLFTSPNNPLGHVYSSDDVTQIMVWAEAAGVHLVLDEIYALSVFGERAFTSGAQLRESLGDFVHLVWAFSKDFGASGLRCGLLVSENEPLLEAIDALAYWACASGHTQYLLGELISDDAWVDGYIERMRSGLRDSHRRVVSALDEEGVPYLHSDAGFFFLCDLRQYLSEPKHRAERDLWRHVVETANVNLTPGAACEIAEPGFFRLCFASVPPDVAELGVRRLGEALRRF